MTANDVFTSYANSPSWTLVHRGPIRRVRRSLFSELLGLVLRSQRQLWNPGMVKCFAEALDSCGACAERRPHAVDGVALKQAVDAWMSAPASEQSAYFAVVQGIRGCEWGMRSYVDFTTGSHPRPVRDRDRLDGKDSQAYRLPHGIVRPGIHRSGLWYGTGYTSISNFVTDAEQLKLSILYFCVDHLAAHRAWRRKESVQAAPA